MESFRTGEERGRVRTSTADVVERRYVGDVALARHDHDYACVDLVLSGCVRERYRTIEREARAGDVLFYEPDAHHAWSSPGARILHMIVPRELLWAQGGVEAPVESTRLPGLTTALAREFDIGDSLALESVAAEIISELRCWRERERSRPAWLDEAVEMVLAGSPTLSELATATGVNAGHLVRTFRQRLGCTPGELSRRARLAEAARRLASNDGSIAEIALDAGFSDQAHLTRAFRARYGATPGAYRAARLGAG